MGKGLETLVKGVLISSLLVAPVLSTDSDAAKRPRARAEAQTQTREQLRRSNLERYIQTYGHVEPNGQRMTDTAIANFYIPMMQQSVYDTLRNTNVREVTPENFDRMVYGDTRPKLVMFSRDMRGQTPDYSRGLASVFRALSVDFRNQVDFYVFHSDKYIDNQNNWTDNRASSLYSRENIRGPPNLGLYWNRDLTGRDRSTRMRQIDLCRGGRDNANLWSSTYNDFKFYWINPNIFGIVHSDGAYRLFGTTFEWQRIQIQNR